MIVREANDSDIPAIARVHIDTWRTTYSGIMPDEVLANLSYEKREQGWRQIFNNAVSSQFFGVAENELGQIVGFACGGPERTDDPIYKGELYAIYILKNYQQQGIGRRLTVEVIQRLAQANIYSMLVWVLADNPSCRFYEALGGQKVYEKPLEIGGVILNEVAYGWTDTGIVVPHNSDDNLPKANNKQQTTNNK
jgi:ribosomal protein S18 acetylase RimI-like enzyme